MLILFDHFVHSERGAKLVAGVSAELKPWFGDFNIADLLDQVKSNTVTANQAMTVATAASNVASLAHSVATTTANTVAQAAPKVGAAGQAMT